MLPKIDLNKALATLYRELADLWDRLEAIERHLGMNR